MVAPDILHQIEVRSRSATGQTYTCYGGLATVLSGDFLQLPHPTLPSLATPMDELTGMYVDKAEGNEDTENEGEDPVDKKEAVFEHRAGFRLWQRISKVTSLTLNLRSPGALADILHDMRARKISDASWEKLQERVLGVVRENGVLQRICTPEADPRLDQPPFSNNLVQYIVHRHVLRVSQSFHNICRTSRRLRKRVYVVLAADTVRSSEASLLTEAIRKRALQIANPRKTQRLPGVCVLHNGMTLLLYSKMCVRLGLMNGCACVLEEKHWNNRSQGRSSRTMKMT